MPYEWVKPRAAPEESGAVAVSHPPIAELHLWPYRSLPLRGFVTFMVITLLLIAVPLTVALGSPVLWGVLPFFMLTIWGLYLAFRRNYRDGHVLERLLVWDDHVQLIRTGTYERRREWEANPHWVRLTLIPEGGPVPNYITLRGSNREVEIGAFLSEEERQALAAELRPLFGPRR
ncbi:DUF2244 domain-containing protein [Ketogulonicigenium vulgare]|uniref:Integral membrane protein-like protein n=1 Tax=Ketogulonicigenium vulgare (strain WSH-001) TaxID=759362 RepID=F9Y4S3_KETVW|nr:DUF2244 domain-containing protein [Ketogulonicigenium vulgare]ADO43530.1 conserved hypothetical protein [Ketogulonicigenium vulgare Y25]AEM41807.1 Integral membrane protein-like protein [Ketogulonicigenium vulgare WSH-001]ALJ81914.1 hypothetical protein KVH_12515 [Ketogulonicigenium vulgare]ANW34561.1 hypothetical protein KvSKV_12435 [Ketogulonicigenium vulgare]AOZ55565.1 hypothetical protein KVC_2563 [Ketogulonicigenium vulgare]